MEPQLVQYVAIGLTTMEHIPPTFLILRQEVAAVVATVEAAAIFLEVV